jgi:hypothetical protein
MSEPSTQVETPSSPQPAQRRRRGLKRTKFQVPQKMPLPIKALWEAAGEEERASAHRTAVEILCAWLGKTTRAEAAARLSMPPLRFWQLSQQAVAGMVAGLLRQPRARRGRPPQGGEPSPGAESLRKEIARLTDELSGAKSLIAILRELPAHREARATPGESPDGRTSRDGTAVAGRAEGADRPKVARRRARRAKGDDPRAGQKSADAAAVGGARA